MYNIMQNEWNAHLNIMSKHVKCVSVHMEKLIAGVPIVA